jgi:hypothetical protein
MDSTILGNVPLSIGEAQVPIIIDNQDVYIFNTL